MPTDTEFVPFVIKAGGRLATTTSEWLGGFWKDVADQKGFLNVRYVCVIILHNLDFTARIIINKVTVKTAKEESIL